MKAIIGAWERRAMPQKLIGGFMPSSSCCRRLKQTATSCDSARRNGGYRSDKPRRTCNVPEKSLRRITPWSVLTSLARVLPCWTKSSKPASAASNTAMPWCLEASGAANQTSGRQLDGNKNPAIADGVVCVRSCREIDSDNQRPLLFPEGSCMAFSP